MKRSLSLSYDEMIAEVLAAIEDSPVRMVPVNRLLTDESPRLSGTSAEHVQALAQVKDNLPPIVVHQPTMQVIDGAHRVQAARLQKADLITARFFEGDEHMAFMLSVRFNVQHGLPLTLADRSAAAERILHANPLLADRVIAATVGLSAVTVASIRLRSADDSVQSSVRLGLDGKIRPLSSADGRRKAHVLIAENESMSLREVARRSGISLATASDVRKRVARGDDPVPLRFQGKQGRTSRRTEQRPMRAIDPGERETILRSLLRDPALRYSDAGRAALSWLSAHVLGIERGSQFVGSLPSHCLEHVGKVARACEEEWRSLASEVESRMSE
jgi:hypothetical protein